MELSGSRHFNGVSLRCCQVNLIFCVSYDLKSVLLDKLLINTVDRGSRIWKCSNVRKVICFTFTLAFYANSKVYQRCRATVDSIKVAISFVAMEF